MSSFQNYPNNSDTFLAPVIFIPSTLIIIAITQDFPMQVTCTVPASGANTYIIGQTVRLNVPYAYGMFQANGLSANILAIDDLVFSLNINSAGFDPFVIPSGNATEPASMAPAGSRNLQYDNSTNQVAFQPLNNVGN
jgi:hypothetical protein